MTNKPLRITHIHACNLNLGDEAITHSLYNLFSEYNAVYSDITSHSENDVRIIDKCNNFSIIKSIQMIYKSDLVVIGPGDVITEWLFTYKCMVIAWLLNKKTVCIGVGLNLSKLSGVYDAIIRQCLQIPMLYIVRDFKSYNTLLDYGIDISKVKLTCDIFYSMAINTSTVISEKTSTKYVVLSLRSMEYNSRTWSEDIYTEIAKSVDYLIDKYNYEIKLLPMLSASRNAVRLTMLPDDEQFLMNVYGKVKNKKRVVMLTNIDNYSMVLQVLKDADFVIATRLHVAIMSMCVLTPFLLMSYGIKTDSFAKDNDLNDLTLDIKTINSEPLNLAIDGLIKNHSIIVARLRNILASNNKLAETYKTEIANVISQLRRQ